MVTIALGVAATTLLFGVVKAVLLLRSARLRSGRKPQRDRGPHGARRGANTHLPDGRLAGGGAHGGWRGPGLGWLDGDAVGHEERRLRSEPSGCLSAPHELQEYALRIAQVVLEEPGTVRAETFATDEGRVPVRREADVRSDSVNEATFPPAKLHRQLSFLLESPGVEAQQAAVPGSASEK